MPTRLGSKPRPGAIGRPANKGTFKKPQDLEGVINLNARLKKAQAKAQVSWGIPALQRGAKAAHSNRGKKVIPFRNQTPEVRAKAEEWLARLLLKHKEKRDQMDPVHRSRHF